MIMDVLLSEGINKPKRTTEKLARSQTVLFSCKKNLLAIRCSNCFPWASGFTGVREKMCVIKRAGYWKKGD